MRTPDAHNLPHPMRENRRQPPNPLSSPKTILSGEGLLAKMCVRNRV